MSSDLNWWRGGVIYQIYPRSFFDSNGDGIGDIPGVIAHLDYIAELGVDAIWLSPFFTSPMKDFGYDISDYKDVDPMFGSLHDFKHLIEEAHQKGLKVIIDQVYSHTSDQHLWFKESRESRDNPKADWYVWADPKPDGTAPNNWLSLFGGPAWQFDTRRGQYFMHNFLASQPDLNFHNPDVQNAILDTARFWLELGVDGFRLDVVNMYFHDAALTDNGLADSPEKQFVGADKVNPFTRQYHVNQMCRDENLDFLKRLRAVMDEFPGTTTVGEIGAPGGMKYMAQYTSNGDKLHMAYTFELLEKEHSVDYIRGTIERVEQNLGDGWPCFALSNHDVERSASRWGKDADDPKAYVRTTLGLLATLRGSPCIYQGEELGLPEAEVPFELLQDPFGIEFWPEFKGRDGCRTPIPWLNEAMGGFTSGGHPWLPIEPIHRQLAVGEQGVDTESTLNFSRQLLAWRREHPALKDGRFEWLDSDKDLLLFRRVNDQESLVIALNMTSRELPVEVSGSAQTVPGFQAATGDRIPAYTLAAWTE
ncbi:alpha-glucosidase [Saccharospirillum sp. MSK14-1]|uniref:alpha-amylase family glycosyl hydrolase n=1 Tax=Saccharospirillum sp. MSK14-1 TaxID=1897632 RepID=UPI000D3BF30D|nr:alpha-amylase family glycosyl hydrolase [Saccharospirillum sp. MSK14-1]PTY37785.1 alpha-glucosidase [Saccharospirillum sp. MSK14-1]